MRPTSTGRTFSSILAAAGLLLAGLSSAAGPPAAEESATQRAMAQGRRAAVKLAAAEAVKSAVHELGQRRPPTGLEDAWARRMLDDPADHASEEDSRELLRSRYREVLEAELGEQLARIHGSFNPPDRDPPWFAADFLRRYLEGRLTAELEGSLEASAERHFEPTFARARKLAVDRQSATLDAQARLDGAELDAFLRDGLDADERRRLVDLLTSRMSSGAPLLDEVKRRLDKLADGAVENALGQYREQVAVVEGSPSGDKSSEALAAAFERRLEAVAARGRGSGGYGVFPSVRERIPGRAAALERERFGAFCRGHPTAPPDERLRAVVENDLRHHHTPSASLQLLRERLRRDAGDAALEEYARDAGATPAFRSRLRHLLDRDPEIRQALDDGLDRSLAAPLRRVREGIAGEQLAKHFPAVASSRWRVPENLLLDIHRGNFVHATFEDSEGLPKLREGGVPYRSGELLEETRNRVFLETAKLIEEGKRAWVGQLQLVRGLEAEIPVEMRKNKSERTLEGWQEYFIEELTERWQRERGNLVWRGFTEIPEHATLKYLPVFGYMAERIRREVASQYELDEKPPTEVTPVIEDRQVALDDTTQGKDSSPSQETGDAVSGGGDDSAANEVPNGGGGLMCLDPGLHPGILQCFEDGTGHFSPTGPSTPFPTSPGEPFPVEPAEPGTPRESPVTYLGQARLEPAPLPARLGWLALLAASGLAAWWFHTRGGPELRGWGTALLCLLLLLAGVWVWNTPARLEIGVADLDRAAPELGRRLGVPPERVDPRTAEFRIGFLRKVVLVRDDSLAAEDGR